MTFEKTRGGSCSFTDAYIMALPPTVMRKNKKGVPVIHALEKIQVSVMHLGLKSEVSLKQVLYAAHKPSGMKH